jgi:5-(carboxyamino)imidazole ribonucleotide synthase
MPHPPRHAHISVSCPPMTSWPTLGILGGGQLARMTAYAAYRLGLRVHIMEKSPGSPAGQIAHRETVGDPSDHRLLVDFASRCDVVTLESEFINEDHLVEIERAGSKLYPSSGSVGKIQDKLLQKQTLEAAGIPVAPFAGIGEHGDAEAFGERHGYPFVLKARRGGYDGYGNATIKAPIGIGAGWQKITAGSRSVELYAEEFVPFERELAVMVARGRDGGIVTYPLVETVQEHHICHLVSVPARVSESVAADALDYARRAVEAIDGVGIFGIELFVTADGSVVVNEMAPRPHNSGHYTIEGCVTSQFENHIRAIMGWPLGSTELRAPGVAMVNILGRTSESGAVGDFPAALVNPRAHLHIYGKSESRAGRKMGHVTVLAETVEEAITEAEEAERSVRFAALEAPANGDPTA